MEDKLWYKVAAQQAISDFSSDLDKGLTQAEAEHRLQQYGFNELEAKEGLTVWQMFLAQFKDFMVLVLLAASVVSFFVGEVADAMIIITIVILNAILGVYQEARAEKSLEALKRMAAPTSKVLRNGKQEAIPSRLLVPGDIVNLEAGDYVPADLRLLESFNLKIEEASFTGESVPAEKDTKTIDQDVPLGDRKNMSFMTTIITYGRGKGLVVSTGMRTEIGKIAEMLQQYQQQNTPLQRKLEEFGKILAVGSLVICGVIFAIGLLRGEPLLDMFMTAVSLAVAAIPEGLPSVVTIVLALGMQRMIKKNAIVKKLHAVETLGSVTVICTDKTGTLTQNQMTVTTVYAGDKLYGVTGEGYNPEGTFSVDGASIKPEQQLDLNLLLKGSALCNDARLQQNDDSTWRIAGDPTEGALVVAAEKAGYTRQRLESDYPRFQEIPFDSARKMMTTINEYDGKVLAFVKGAPDILISRCTCIMRDGIVLPLTDSDRDTIAENNQAMASKALRVLAVACREFPDVPQHAAPQSIESSLTFIGLLGMIDPPRAEAREAVAVCKSAGIRAVMITGDHKDTALAIAKELGIADETSRALTGPDLDALSKEEIQQVVKATSVFARVSPQNKVDIVTALQENNEIAAMTGDGVNDAPALKKADIGIAMGITGTDVAKETADMVLTDDNFASIVAAVEEGRVIFSNIRKFVFFLLSCNIAEVLIVFITMLLGWPIPLLPIQLLWLNLVTDAFPALALGMEKKEPDVMKVRPRDPQESLLNREMKIMIAIQSTVLALAVLGAFRFALGNFGGDLVMARTYAFVTLILAELIRAYSARANHYSVFTIGFFSNRYMNLGVGFSVVMLLVVMYVPFLRDIFKLALIDFRNFEVIVAFALLPFVSAELGKIVTRPKQ